MVWDRGITSAFAKIIVSRITLMIILNSSKGVRYYASSGILNVPWKVLSPLIQNGRVSSKFISWSHYHCFSSLLRRVTRAKFTHFCSNNSSTFEKREDNHLFRNIHRSYHIDAVKFFKWKFEYFWIIVVLRNWRQSEYGGKLVLLPSVVYL